MLIPKSNTLERDKILSSRIPMILAIIIFVFTASIYFYDLDTSMRHVETSTEQVVEIAAEKISELLFDHIDLVNTLMMNQWISTNNSNDLLDYGRYLQIVPGFFNYYDSYLAINFIDTNLIARWIYPFEPNKAVLNQSLKYLADGSINTALLEAQMTKNLRITPVITLYQDLIGLAAYIPIIYQGISYGFFNVVFTIDPLILQINKAIDLQNYSFQIEENSTIFFRQGENFLPKSDFVQLRLIQFYEHDWVLYVRPNKGLRFIGSPWNNIEILIFGSFATLLAFMFSRFILKQNEILEQNFQKKEELEKIMSQYQKMDDLGILAGGIAHDFNNLLMGLQGNFSILDDILLKKIREIGSIDQSLLQRIDNTFSSIQKLLTRSANLTSQILSFSRQSMIDYEIINLQEIVEDTLTIISESSDKRIIFTKNFQDKLMFIWGNQSKMSQIIMNVVLNSIDALQTGGSIDIETSIVPRHKTVISTQNLSDEVKFDKDNEILLTIKDNGIGIDSGNIEKLFVPFFTTKIKTRKGTGLGLSIVYRSIKTMSGDIIIDSIKEKGTTVKIYLPLILEKYLKQNNPLIINPSINGQVNVKINPSTKSIPTNLGLGLKVLMVEDEEAIRHSVKYYLEKNKAIVTAFENGNNALREYLKKGDINYNLVILDINLPGINGIDLFNKIREVNSQQKVLFMTGYSEQSIPFTNDKNVFVLIKPFNESDLKIILDQINNE